MASRIVNQSLKFEYYDGCPPDDAPLGSTTGWRKLPFLLFSVVLDGEVLLRIKKSDDVLIKKGEAWLVPAGLMHKIDIISSKRAWLMWCHINFTIMGTVDLISQLDIPVVIGAKEAIPLTNTCKDLVTLDADKVLNPLRMAVRQKELGFRFLTNLMDLSKMRFERIDILISDYDLEPVFEYIKSHLADAMTIEDLARIACRSRSGLHQTFREIIGKTPMEFIRELRIQSAQLLLAGSDLRIGEIAERVGYHDPFHFSRTFKVSCGVSPSRFRWEQRQAPWSGEH